jgi:HSP20 family molecular chaperone IbpA
MASINSKFIEPEILTDEGTCEMGGSTLVKLRYNLPGVSQDHLNLKINRETLSFVAQAGNKTQFCSDYKFNCCYAIPEKARYFLDKGVLIIEIPTKCD